MHTVNDEIQAKFRKSAELEVEEMINQSVDQSVREKMLGESVRRLGNQSEVEALSVETSTNINPNQVFENAKWALVYQFLQDNEKYNAEDTLERMRTGRRMGCGMERHAREAMLYADGHLMPVNKEDALRELQSLFVALENKNITGVERERKWRDAIRAVQLRTRDGSEDISDVGLSALKEAREELVKANERKLDFRKKRSNMDVREMYSIVQKQGRLSK